MRLEDKALKLEGEELERAALLFSALGNKLRLKVILLLASTDRPLHIKAVSKRLGVSYPTIYRHIAVLRRAGLVKVYEVGRSRVVALTKPEALEKVLSTSRELKT